MSLGFIVFSYVVNEFRFSCCSHSVYAVTRTYYFLPLTSFSLVNYGFRNNSVSVFDNARNYLQILGIGFKMSVIIYKWAVFTDFDDLEIWFRGMILNNVFNCSIHVTVAARLSFPKYAQKTVIGIWLGLDGLVISELLGDLR